MHRPDWQIIVAPDSFGVVRVTTVADVGISAVSAEPLTKVICRALDQFTKKLEGAK
jgi:hypothetical protein